MILLTKERYVELLNVESKMELLKQAGVDNWDYYVESLHRPKHGGTPIADCESDNHRQAEREDRVGVKGFVIPNVLTGFTDGEFGVVAVTREQDDVFVQPVILFKEQP